MVNNLKKFGIAGLVIVGLLMLMIFSTGCVNNSGGKTPTTQATTVPTAAPVQRRYTGCTPGNNGSSRYSTGNLNHYRKPDH